MSLDAIPLGSRFRITGVRTGNSLSFRLMEMGLIEGAEGRVLRRAPFGDPLQFRLGDYDLSLRSSEAALIDAMVF